MSERKKDYIYGTKIRSRAGFFFYFKNENQRTVEWFIKNVLQITDNPTFYIQGKYISKPKSNEHISDDQKLENISLAVCPLRNSKEKGMISNVNSNKSIKDIQHNK